MGREIAVQTEALTSLSKEYSSYGENIYSKYKTGASKIERELESILRSYSDYSSVTSKVYQLQSKLKGTERQIKEVQERAGKLSNGLNAAVQAYATTENEEKRLIGKEGLDVKKLGKASVDNNVGIRINTDIETNKIVRSSESTQNPVGINGNFNLKQGESLGNKIINLVDDIIEEPKDAMNVLKGMALVGAVILNPNSSQYVQFIAVLKELLNKKGSSLELNPIKSESDLSYLEGGILYQKIGGKIYKNGELVSEKDYKYIPHEIGGLRIIDGNGTFAKAYVENGIVYEQIGSQIYKNSILVPEENYKYIPREIGGLRNTVGKGSYVMVSQTYMEGNDVYQRIGGIIYKNGKEIAVQNYKYIPQEIGGTRELEGNGTFVQGYKEGEYTYIKMGDIIYKNGKEVAKEDYKYIPQEVGGLRETVGNGMYITDNLVDMITGTGTSTAQLEGEALASYWRKQVVDKSSAFIGKITYLYGSNKSQVIDPNNPPQYMDCSDFVGSIYMTVFGIDLGGYTVVQCEKGTKVSYEELKPGDLIFFDTDGINNGKITHVGIYMGDGKFIDEGGGDYKGNVRVQDLNSYWKGAVVTCRRVIQDNGTLVNSSSEPLPNAKIETDNETLINPNDSTNNTTSTEGNSGKISLKGINFILTTEGFYAKAYRGVDSQNLTIGYGHVIREGESFGTLTKEEAKELFMNDLYENGYVQAVVDFEKKIGKKFTQNEFDALVSFSFNLGKYCFSKYEESDFVKLIKGGNYTEKEFIDAITQFHHSNGKDVKGLYNRRYDEGEIFLYGDYEREYKREIHN